MVCTQPNAWVLVHGAAATLAHTQEGCAQPALMSSVPEHAEGLYKEPCFDFDFSLDCKNKEEGQGCSITANQNIWPILVKMQSVSGG